MTSGMYPWSFVTRYKADIITISLNVTRFRNDIAVKLLILALDRSAKCSTQPFSNLLTCILSAFKTGLQSYCDTSYASCVNQMWILKNSKDMLDYIQSRSLCSCNNIKTFYFSTLYTTIPHAKLKDI